MRIKIRYIILLIGLTAFFALLFLQNKSFRKLIPLPQGATRVKVVRVIDGDTIEIEGGRKIRYIGMDTPEIHHPKKPVQCYGKIAAEKNKELVEGKEVRLEKDVSETDRYGRLLRFVYIDQQVASGSSTLFINDYLVRQGYAHVATFPPDIKYQEQFTLAQEEAEKNNRGLWASCPLVR